MTNLKLHKLPFDRRGGILITSMALMKSPAYMELTCAARELMRQMQIHWRHDKAVDYGVREAMDKLGCAKGTAQKAFKQLEDAGFIVKVNESMFSSRMQSKTRSWRLTWLPWMSKYPTNEWEKIDATGSKMYSVKVPQGQKCTL